MCVLYVIRNMRLLYEVVRRIILLMCVRMRRFGRWKLRRLDWILILKLLFVNVRLLCLRCVLICVLLLKFVLMNMRRDIARYDLRVNMIM